MPIALTIAEGNGRGKRFRFHGERVSVGRGAENDVLRHWGTHTMAWAEDDMEIVQRMAQQVGIGLPQAGLNRELCRTLKPKRFRLDEYGV